MKLIIGLGNPGKKYKGTRHNVGYFVIDRLKNYPCLRRQELPSASWRTNYQLLNSASFMNESGKFVKRLVNKDKLPLDEFLIIHDDLDVALGEFKLQKGRGAAGHKGVESIIAVLGSKEFWRLRVGIGRPRLGLESEDYVLGKFSPAEMEKIVKIIPDVRSVIQKI